MSDTTSDLDIWIIKPPGLWPGLGLAEVWRSRRALFVLARRDFKASYSNMVLGILWALLEPIMLSIITVFMGLVLGRGNRLGLPFPVFIFSAFVVFRPWSRLVNEGGSAVRANAVFVERIYLPRAFLPLSVALASVTNLVFLAVTLCLLLWFFAISPGVGLLMWPFALVIMCSFGLGAAFFSAAIGMSFPDMDFIRPVLTRACSGCRPSSAQAQWSPRSSATSTTSNRWS